MLDGADVVVHPIDPTSPTEAIDEAALPEDFSGVLVSTSGSTRYPKTVMLSRSALITAAEIAHNRLSGPGHWVNPLPSWYVAGLMTIVRAHIAGQKYRQIPSDLMLVEPVNPRTYISVVPPQLNRVVSNQDACARLATFEAVLVGGGPLDQSLRLACEDAGIKIVATYGMSETCGGVVYNGVPLDGVEVECLADSGRIAISTPTVFDGYLGDAVATAEVLDGHRFLTSDRGCWSDGRLQVLSRIDEVVCAGGINVDLGWIQQILDQHFPGQVTCFSVPDPVWGVTIIVASIKPNLSQIKTVLAGLDSVAQPRGLLALNTLPLSDSGKIDRTALVERWISGQRT